MDDDHNKPPKPTETKESNYEDNTNNPEQNNIDSKRIHTMNFKKKEPANKNQNTFDNISTIRIFGKRKNLDDLDKTSTIKITDPYKKQKGINDENNIPNEHKNKRSSISRFGTLARNLTSKINPSYTDREIYKLKKKKELHRETEETYICDDDYDSEIYESKSIPINYRPENGITIKKFYDYRPVEKKYFEKPKCESGDREGLSVVFPFFNEESHELQESLNSLDDGYIELKRRSKKWSKQPMYVCLIQDGWHKASKSMQEYLKIMFPGKIKGLYWWNYFKEFESGFKDSNSNAIFVFERKNYMPTIVNNQPEFKDMKKFMKITLVIKVNNRRKHNSHEWFLGKNGFAEATNGRYLFLTDAFTYFSKTCLFYLVKELDKNPKLCAVTGRQRLMSREQQGSSESIFSLGYLLRMVQLYDFELANAVYNGAFHIGGLLPVIPGPCGLYRASDVLQDSVRESYFNVVNEEPSKTGLILGNLRIAEDRVLSSYSVLKSAGQKSMAFNPLAVFYFEAETDLQRFILQRRRWINGSIAGYIYLLFINFSDIINWDVNIFRKFYVWLLLMSQFLIYCMVAVAPGISIKILYFGINYFLNYYGIFLDWQLTVIFLVLWAIYIAHVFIHNKSKFNYPIMYILLILSIATSVISFASLFHYAFVFSQLSIYSILTSKDIVLYLGMSVFILPFLLALLLSGKGHSLMYMIKSLIPYLLFMHMMIAWFGSYSYSRTWDLTWGNRPASELNDISDDQKKIMVTKFKEKSVRIILLLIALNFGIFFVPLQGQLIIMSIFFVIALFQMFFSFLFCVYKIFYKFRMIFNKCKRIKSSKMNEVVIV